MKILNSHLTIYFISGKEILCNVFHIYPLFSGIYMEIEKSEVGY